MSEENTKIVSSTSASNQADPITAEALKSTAEILGQQHIDSLVASGIFHGVKVLPDYTGMICGPNEYSVVVGEKLYEKLRSYKV